MILTTSLLGALLIQLDSIRLRDLQSPQEIIASYAKQYEVEPAILVEVSRCESNFKHDVYGDRGKAYGIMQFWENTFNQFKKEANLEHLEYKNLKDQAQLAAWAFSKGYQNHWTCYRKVVNAP